MDLRIISMDKYDYRVLDFVMENLRSCELLLCFMSFRKDKCGIRFSFSIRTIWSLDQFYTARTIKSRYQLMRVIEHKAQVSALLWGLYLPHHRYSRPIDFRYDSVWVLRFFSGMLITEKSEWRTAKIFNSQFNSLNQGVVVSRDMNELCWYFFLITNKRRAFNNSIYNTVKRIKII